MKLIHLFLKICAHEFAIPLNIIFQRSLIEVKFQVNGKWPTLHQFSRKVVVTIAANYRPVSLTSIFCKLMEKIVRRHFHDISGIGKT